MTTEEFKTVCKWIANGDCEHYTGTTWVVFPRSGYDKLVTSERFSSYRHADPYAALKQAHKEGKTIQCKNKGISFDNWCDVIHPAWIEVCDYRIKPSPTLRPWKPEEVPVGAQLKCITSPFSSLITAACYEGIMFTVRYGSVFDSYERMAQQDGDVYQYSLDHGKTWLPCGVMEEKE